MSVQSSLKRKISEASPDALVMEFAAVSNFAIYPRVFRDSPKNLHFFASATKYLKSGVTKVFNTGIHYVPTGGEESYETIANLPFEDFTHIMPGDISFHFVVTEFEISFRITNNTSKTICIERGQPLLILIFGEALNPVPNRRIGYTTRDGAISFRPQKYSFIDSATGHRRSEIPASTVYYTRDGETMTLDNDAMFPEDLPTVGFYNETWSWSDDGPKRRRLASELMDAEEAPEVPIAEEAPEDPPAPEESLALVPVEPIDELPEYPYDPNGEESEEEEEPFQDDGSEYLPENDSDSEDSDDAEPEDSGPEAEDSGPDAEDSGSEAESEDSGSEGDYEYREPNTYLMTMGQNRPLPASSPLPNSLFEAFVQQNSRFGSRMERHILDMAENLIQGRILLSETSDGGMRIISLGPRIIAGGLVNVRENAEDST